MNKFSTLFKKYKSYFITITAILATFTVLFQNIEYFFQKTKDITSNISKDIIIVDQFINSDTFDIRLINNGNKTIPIREAKIIVDSTWTIYEQDYGAFDFVDGRYDVYLIDSLKPYVTTFKVFQSIKPNEVDRFQIVLRGGSIIETDLSKLKMGIKSNRSIYFMLFKIEFLLNNTNIKISTPPMIHVFGEIKEKQILTYNKHLSNIYIYDSLYKLNYRNAINISKLDCYKSQKTKELIELILTK